MCCDRVEVSYPITILVSLDGWGEQRRNGVEGRYFNRYLQSTRGRRSDKAIDEAWHRRPELFGPVLSRALPAIIHATTSSLVNNRAKHLPTDSCDYCYPLEPDEDVAEEVPSR